MMKIRSFESVLSWIRKKSPAVSEIKHLTPERLAWMIESLGYAFPRILKCLPLALSGFVLLRNKGWDVTLKIGTQRGVNDSNLRAHAWLEKDGTILIGNLPDIDSYSVFNEFEGKFL